MEASEMVDVLHYLFEDDFLSTHPEIVEAKSDIRTLIYESLYEEEYRYKVKKSNTTYNANGQSVSDGFYGAYDAEDDLTPFDPMAGGPTKPYVPPTDFDGNSPLPFGGVLDGPLGG